MGIPNGAWLPIAALLIGAPPARQVATSVPAPSGEDWSRLGKAVVSELGSRQFEKVEARFDAAMSQALPHGQLAALWDGLVAEAGTFNSIEGARVEAKGAYTIVFVTSRFAKTTLDLELSFDAEARLAGLHVLPAGSSASAGPQPQWTPPPYAQPAAYHERSVTVGQRPWTLAGTLTLPNGHGPFPAVLLVQGSGPEDEDETIGPNKPFKDLAWGLATHGIAVLRYNKRTFEHAAELKYDSAGFTVMEETVSDAQAAVSLAARQPEIDPKRIVVLGHSLGGTLAPRIARGDPQVAGIILLAGGARPLEKVIVDQLRYLARLNPPGATESEVAGAERAAREIESLTLKATDTVTVLGSETPGSYWLDLRVYNAPATAAGLKIPILVLQAGRDYQVTEEDFNLWKKALAGDAHATFKLYPSLFHLFMPSSTAGSGLGSPADYQKPGHVAEPVIRDIAAWIEALKG